jgi:hypothetical protein
LLIPYLVTLQLTVKIIHQVAHSSKEITLVHLGNSGFVLLWQELRKPGIGIWLTLNG